MKEIIQNQDYQYNYQYELRKYISRYYNQQFTQIETIYFQFDKDESIIDDKLDSGTYTKMGDKSGYRWKMYNLLPLYSASSLSEISYQITEKGIDYDITLDFVLSNQYKIYPSQLDFIYIIDKLQPPENNIILYEVVDIQQMDISSIGLWKISQKQSQYLLNQILNQISKKYIHIPYYNSLVENELGLHQINIMKNLKNIYKIINFDNHSESYFQESR